MLRIGWLLLLSFSCALAAERTFDFTGAREGEQPRGFSATQTGAGKPGEWKIVLDEVPLVVAPFSPKAPVDTKKPVLAQVSTDTNETRAPMLQLDAETFGDFTFSTRIKIVSGGVEQMAGVAFRIQNEKNYYYVRLNAKDHNVSFFRYVEGELIGPVSAAADIRPGAWYRLAVECRGAKLRALLEEKEVIPWTEPNYVPLPDGSSKGVFAAGKIAFWTKSDTVAHFAEARIVYIPREPFAQSLLRETINLNPRLLGLKIFAAGNGEEAPRMIASDKQEEVGEPGTKVERDCISRGGTYSGKGKETAVVTMPLHDRNGEIVGAARVVMTTFIGQTEKNMLARALPIVKYLEGRIGSAKELME